jgi:hypothetical protein
MRLPELSYRLAHHFPDALPFIVPFYNKLEKAGFEIDERKLKPVLRRNGKRIITDYSTGGSVVVFRLYGQKNKITSVDLKKLKAEISKVQQVSDYGAIDGKLDALVDQLAQATNR